MADLLECLLQIKGLRETADRVAALAANVDEARWTRPGGAGRPSAADLLRKMAEIEVVHGAWLRVMLASPHPSLPAVENSTQSVIAPGGSALEWAERFLAHRRANLALLDHCSATDLARTAVHPTRRVISMADLVAMMLAGDTEWLGEIRSLLVGN